MWPRSHMASWLRSHVTTRPHVHVATWLRGYVTTWPRRQHSLHVRCENCRAICEDSPKNAIEAICSTSCSSQTSNALKLSDSPVFVPEATHKQHVRLRWEAWSRACCLLPACVLPAACFLLLAACPAAAFCMLPAACCLLPDTERMQAQQLHKKAASFRF